MSGTKKIAFFDDKKIELIVKQVCTYFELNPLKVFSMTRKREYKTARQIIHYLSKKHTKKSLDAIGQVSLLYGRPKKHDHATVLNSNKAVNNLMETDNSFLLDVQKIEFAFKKIISELTPAEIEELTALEVSHKLQETILEKNHEISLLRSTIGMMKNNVVNNSDNIYINQLLVMDERVINMFCETRLKPFLRMLKSRVTNEDSIEKQHQTRA